MVDSGMNSGSFELYPSHVRQTLPTAHLRTSSWVQKHHTRVYAFRSAYHYQQCQDLFSMASKSTNPGKRVSVNLVIAIVYLHGKSAAPQSSPDTRLCSVVQFNLRAAMDAHFLRACQDAVVRSAYDLREQNDRELQTQDLGSQTKDLGPSALHQLMRLRPVSSSYFRVFFFEFEH